MFSIEPFSKFQFGVELRGEREDVILVISPLLLNQMEQQSLAQLEPSKFLVRNQLKLTQQR